MADIEQLKAAIRDTSKPIEEVLWFAEEVAKKHNVECPAWIREELKDYASSAAAPPYRRVRGVLHLLSWNGWAPYPRGGVEDLLDQCEPRYLLASIGSIDSSVRSRTPVSVQVPDAVAKEILKRRDAFNQLQIVIPVDQQANVLTAVRSLLHTWAINLPVPQQPATPPTPSVQLAPAKPDEKKTDWLWLGKANSLLDLWNKIPDGAKKAIGGLLVGASTLFMLLFKSCQH